MDIPCPGSHVCEFAVLPTVPYYWDPDCVNGGLGCMADGVNAQCRYCAERPFENVTCPEHVAPLRTSAPGPSRARPRCRTTGTNPARWACWAAGQTVSTRSAASVGRGCTSRSTARTPPQPMAGAGCAGY